MTIPNPTMEKIFADEPRIVRIESMLKRLSDIEHVCKIEGETLYNLAQTAEDIEEKTGAEPNISLKVYEIFSVLNVFSFIKTNADLIRNIAASSLPPPPATLKDEKDE